MENFSNTTEKGSLYEKFICNHINNTIENTLAYPWKDVSDQILYECNFIENFDECREQREEIKNKLHDIGVDIIQFNQKTNEYTFVQCKNYEGTLCISDLSGYFCIMSQSKHFNKKGVIYISNDKVSSNLKVNCNDNRNKIIHLPMENKEIVNNKIIFNPYDYQIECCDKFEEYYQSHTNGILTMPCGTGKTYCSFLISYNYDIIIILSPLKQFAEQNLENFRKYKNDKNIKYLLVDSDGTRNIHSVRKEIMKSNKIVISCTYKSCDIIKNIIKEYPKAFVIIDEFHNMSYNNIYDNNDHINIIVNSPNKKLYMSATPRIYELEGKKDRNIENILGKIIYSMSFEYAIKNNYIADYDIYLPIDDQQNYMKLLNKVKINDYDQLLCQKVLFLFESIKLFGNMKTILYFQSHEHIDQFMKCMFDTNIYYDYKYCIESIICTDNQKDRNKKLKKFDQSNGTSFLCSVGILDECIDIPSCNSVYITYDCTCKIRIIQRISRALRKYGNKVAKILVWNNNLNNIIKFISSIKEMNIDIAPRVKYINYTDRFVTSEEIKNDKKEYVKKYNEKIDETGKYNEKIGSVEKYEKNNIRSSGKKIYPCHKCPKVFYNATHLKDHLNRKKSCTLLSNKFKNNPKNDIKITTKNEMLIQSANQPKFIINSETLNYYLDNNKCVYCKLEFSCKQSVLRHLKDRCKEKKKIENEKNDIFNRLKATEEENKMLKTKFEKEIAEMKIDIAKVK